MRLEELRREREEVLASAQNSDPEGPQARRSDIARPRSVREMGLLPSVRRSVIR